MNIYKLYDKKRKIFLEKGGRSSPNGDGAVWPTLRRAKLAASNAVDSYSMKASNIEIVEYSAVEKKRFRLKKDESNRVVYDDSINTNIQEEKSTEDLSGI